MGSFDHINHEALLRKLDAYPDLSRLIRAWLKAGIMDNGVFDETKSGTPQGGVISPLLANVYLDKLDKYVEQQLIPAHTRGEARRPNAIYENIKLKAYRARRKGRVEDAKLLR